MRDKVKKKKVEKNLKTKLELKNFAKNALNRLYTRSPVFKLFKLIELKSEEDLDIE